jgi:hypothetical protein
MVLRSNERRATLYMIGHFSQLPSNHFICELDQYLNAKNGDFNCTEVIQ